MEDALMRWLAVETDKPKRSDYSILSVAVLTLGLILLVELGRHRLDHAALGRPFFQAVLEGAYRELSTLGLVEFFIWLLLSYWEDINVSKEKVFVKVHFTLFYTAILNAFQTVIVAFFTTRISHKIWVQTETLELNHYVEIREEFDRVQRELDLAYRGEETKDNATSSGRSSSNWTFESAFEFNWNSVRSAYRSAKTSIRYPGLKRRYNDLLVQVRFHELRVHLLAAYKLPPQFKVSDYLLRTEQHVLIRLVHVSTVAWLLLTASVNLCYFVMGIVTYKTGEPELIGELLTWIFFVGMFVFIVFSLLVSNKMRGIFNTIMERRVLWEANDDEETKIHLARQQRALFWASDPTLVISAIQFMQFGYAVFLAVNLIFWETINNGRVAMETFILSIFGCYAIFVAVTAQTIPRFTLCTNLGQLVDQRRLQEAVAAFHLDQAKRQRQWELEHEEFEMDGTLRETIKQESHEKPRGRYMPKSSSYLRGALSNSGTGANMAGSVTPLTTTSENSNPDEVDPAQLMADLVKLDTSSLRTNLPEVERERLSYRDQRRARKEGRRRMKTVSDGVAAMAAMVDDVVPRATQDDSELFRRNSFRASGSIGSGNSKEDKLSAHDTDADRLAARRARRRSRRKSVSDGVALMAMVTAAQEKEETPPLFVKTSSEVSLGDLSVRTSESKGKMAQDAIPEGKLAPSPAAADLHAMEAKASKDIDDASVASIDGHSDIDDVPDVGFLLAQRHAQPKPEFNLRKSLYKYYLSRRYIALSNVCGTMLAFFFVGERVERFLHTEQVINPGEFVSFDFKETISFWILTSIFFLFLWNDLIICALLLPNRYHLTRKEKSVGLASVIDIMIVGVCVSVFFVAEAERCCGPDDDSYLDRVLAGDDGTDDGSYGAAPCNCPMFGSRLYGGLGTVEPYISLIALRLFRHWLAKRIICALERNADAFQEDNQGLAGTARNPFDVFGDDDDNHGGGAHGGVELRGTAAELWKDAVGKHPEVAAKYGEFSSELLQTMLGIPVKNVAALDESDSFERSKADADPTSPNGSKSFALNDEYAGLTPHAQEIIVAGKLGQKVKCFSTRNLGALGGRPEAIPEETTTSPTNSDDLFFQVDTTVKPEVDSMFLAPNARLVRSMRRGDRKLLPFIDKWTVVDVVLTRQEMVYFDASDLDRPTMEDELEDLRAAVTATKGGKGLRLCDVAAGRKVVGHLALSEIKSAHVEREMPQEDVEEDADDIPEIFIAKNEFWGKSEVTDPLARRCWKKVKQDRLVVESIHGQTLYLRFYSDLEDCELHRDRMTAESEESGDLFKNNSFQWAQTVGRFCGPEQLKQPLPHFGDDTADELRDYLIIHEAEVPRTRITAFTKRLSALPRPARATQAQTAGDSNSDHAIPKPRGLRRASSAMEGSTGIASARDVFDSPSMPFTKKKFHKRTMSFGNLLSMGGGGDSSGHFSDGGGGRRRPSRRTASDTEVDKSVREHAIDEDEYFHAV